MKAEKGGGWKRIHTCFHFRSFRLPYHLRFLCIPRQRRLGEPCLHSFSTALILLFPDTAIADEIQHWLPDNCTYVLVKSASGDGPAEEINNCGVRLKEAPGKLISIPSPLISPTDNSSSNRNSEIPIFVAKSDDECGSDFLELRDVLLDVRWAGTDQDSRRIPSSPPLASV